VSYSGISNGTWHSHVRAQNGAGLWGEASHYTVMIDAAPPPAPVISSSTHSEGVTSSHNDPALSWTTPPDLSGISGYSYVLDQVATTTPDTVSEGSSTTRPYSELQDEFPS
jgi:hypothetical protein